MPRPRKFWLWLVLIGLGAAVLGYSVARLLQIPGAPAAGTDFSLRDLAGKTHNLASFEGKLLLLNFWATWCPPCREEIPIFITLQKRYGEHGLQIVGISIDNPGAVARYWQEMGINYPLLLADETAFGLMTAYGNSRGGLPFSVLIRPDGVVDSIKLGAYSEKELDKLVRANLPSGKPAKP